MTIGKRDGVSWGALDALARMELFKLPEKDRLWTSGWILQAQGLPWWCCGFKNPASWTCYDDDLVQYMLKLYN